MKAQGVIVVHGAEAKINGGSEVNDRKRAREDGLSGPSKRRAGPILKKEEISGDARTQRIQALQVSRISGGLISLVAPDSVHIDGTEFPNGWAT